MEPSCSIANGVKADPYSEDPLSVFLSTATFLVISRPSEETDEDRYSVCLYNSPAGLTYLGTIGSIRS